MYSEEDLKHLFHVFQKDANDARAEARKYRRKFEHCRAECKKWKTKYLEVKKDPVEHLHDECRKRRSPDGPGCKGCKYSCEETVCKASYEGSTLQWVPTSTKLKCRIGYPRIWNLEERE